MNNPTLLLCGRRATLTFFTVRFFSYLLLNNRRERKGWRTYSRCEPPIVNRLAHAYFSFPIFPVFPVFPIPGIPGIPESRYFNPVYTPKLVGPQSPNFHSKYFPLEVHASKFSPISDNFKMVYQKMRKDFWDTLYNSGN